MTRRSLLDIAVRVAATPAGVEFFAKWTQAAQQHQHTNGSEAPPEPTMSQNYRSQFFSPDDFETLAAFTEILIPTDDTPGAREAHCAHYIDFLLLASEEHEASLVDQWRKAIGALRDTGFPSADAQQREAIVNAMSKPERDPSAKHPAYFAYRLIKRENTFAFYTARAGMIQALDYRGNSYNLSFPACTHPEHHVV